MDLRSLAAFRIVLGLVVLMDLTGRFQHARVHYSDAGVLPRERLLDIVSGWRWSLMLINGSEEFVYLFFTITAVAALAVIAGFHTRLAVVILWLLVLSIHVRNPYLQNGGDTYLRLMLFWAMFLPLGNAWSVDHRRQARPRDGGPWVASIGTAALLIQIASMYWFTAVLKDGPEWRSDFSALWYSLGAGHLATPFGAWVDQYQEMLKVLTVAALAVEWIAPLLLFIPLWNGRLRLIAAFSIMGLQLGILATLHVGLFPWISAFSMVVVLPTIFWDALSRLLVRQAWPLSTTWHLVPQRARQTVAALVPQGAWALSAMGADHHMSFLKSGSSTPDASSPTVDRAEIESTGKDRRQDGIPSARSLVSDVLVGICLVLVLAWNVTTVSAFTLSPEARQVTIGLGLQQEWNMFAPRPPRVTQWFLLVGTMGDRQRVNLVPALGSNDFSQATPLTWDRPDNIGTDYYGDKSWRKYLAAVGKNSKRSDQRLLAAYACRMWNSNPANGPELETVQLVSASERTLPEGGTGELVVRQLELFSCG